MTIFFKKENNRYWWGDGETEIHTYIYIYTHMYSYIYLSHGKEWSIDTCYNMNEPQNTVLSKVRCKRYYMLPFT